MGISVRWFDQTNLYYEFVGKWTWEELYTAAAEGMRMAARSRHIGCVVIDMRQSQYVPVLTAEHLARVAGFSGGEYAPSSMIFLGAGHFVRLMFNIFQRIHPQAAQRFRFAETLDDLRLMLAV